MKHNLVHRPKVIRLLAFLLGVVAINGCNIIDFRPEDNLLAEVYNNRLYIEDIEGIIPSGMAPEDSADMVKRYVDSWVDQQVYVYHARQNTDLDRREVEQRLDDYRNALIIHAFEKSLVENELDTVVSHDEISEHYEQFRELFRVRNNLVRVNFVKLPLNASGTNQFRSLYRTDNAGEMERLRDLALSEAASYHVDNETWMPFNEILREMPLNVDDPADFLRSRSFAEITDDYYRYFLYVHDYRLRGDQSPMDFEYENIRKQIINGRKKEMLQQRKRQMLQHAIEGNHIELFF